jgi:hypothetical protein
MQQSLVRTGGRRLASLSSRRARHFHSSARLTDKSTAWLGLAAVGTAAVVVASSPVTTDLAAARIPTGGDIISMGEPVKEKATGIMFPRLCNGMQFAGCVSWE